MVSRVKLILELYHSICWRPEPSALIKQGGQSQLLFASPVFEVKHLVTVVHLPTSTRWYWRMLGLLRRNVNNADYETCGR